MSRRSRSENVQTLWRQVEQELRDSASARRVEPMLERILRLAPQGSEPALFAHRQLAELQLQRHPWRAALHLRRVLDVRQNDDVSHAMMGLCQALLGNFRCAVAAYKRAIVVAPRNPWYHHNLGHLLDVALQRPDSALYHLRVAHDLEPTEDEITASLAHCLACLGRLAEAGALAGEALEMAPDKPDHQALLRWISDGSPGGRASAPPEGALRYGKQETTATTAGVSSVSRLVLECARRGMGEAGFDEAQVRRAATLWSDFESAAPIKGWKPELYAAALEYAVARLDGVRGVTQTEIARRYGVTRAALSSRYGEIRNAVGLLPKDPRYASS